MPKKRLGAAQIVTKLRQIEVLQGQGKSLAGRARRPARRSRAITDTERNTVFLVLTRRSGGGEQPA